LACQHVSISNQPKIDGNIGSAHFTSIGWTFLGSSSSCPIHEIRTTDLVISFLSRKKCGSSMIFKREREVIGEIKWKKTNSRSGTAMMERGKK
jgi:hypothetical protein